AERCIRTAEGGSRMVNAAIATKSVDRCISVPHPRSSFRSGRSRCRKGDSVPERPGWMLMTSAGSAGAHARVVSWIIRHSAPAATGAFNVSPAPALLLAGRSGEDCGMRRGAWGSGSCLRNRARARNRKNRNYKFDYEHEYAAEARAYFATFAL